MSRTHLLAVFLLCLLAGEYGIKAHTTIATSTASTSLAALSSLRDDNDVLLKSGTRIWMLFYATLLAQVVLAIILAVRVYIHTNPARLGEKGCKNWLECYGVPVVFAGLIGAMWAIYMVKIIPPESNSPNNYQNLYRTVGIAGCVFTSVLFIIAVVLLNTIKPNRAAGFIFSMFLSFAFLVGLAVQAGIASILGEWQLFVQNDSVDSTISTSMDNVPGMLNAVFGLSLISAMIPAVESFIREEDKSFSWGRSVRMFLSGASAVGMLWVALAPITNSELMNGKIDQPVRDNWAKLHTPVAMVAFGSLFFYIVSVTVDNCKAGGCGFLNYFGSILSALGLVGLVLSRVLASKFPGPMIEYIFATSEYLSAFALPFAMLGRFNKQDFLDVREAILNGGKA